jgi:hypothetical protein
VRWWQEPHSQLEHRIPYLHGVRLRRFGGKINQIDRIIKLLQRSNTTRALAVLVDPFLDFSDAQAREEFASFCIVQFSRRRDALDCIAYYRAQEFERWWPVNIAELRFLQYEIGRALSLVPGRITTIAADARTRVSRSPTQVAMPIVDRWLDRSPESLHLLANALATGSTNGTQQTSVVTAWRRSLDDQLSAVATFNDDGIPVAIEGLETLAEYLRTEGPDAAELRKLVGTLRELANLNRMWEGSRRDHNDFTTWSPNAQSLIKELQRLSGERIGQTSGDS